MQLFCAISWVFITKRTFYIAMELDTDILKIAQQLIGICFVVRRLYSPSKQENNYNKMNMEIFRYAAISSKCYKFREMFALSLKNPWHNLGAFMDIQTKFSAGWKVNKKSSKIAFCAFY